MRDLHDVVVARAIVHLVTPRIGRLVLSEVEMPVDGEVGPFLAGHVTGGLGDSQAKAASFVVPGADRVSGLCDALLGRNPDLVALSQAAARRLYDVTQGDERISGGTLAVLLCRALRADGRACQLVALLKLDPSRAFRTVEDSDASGRTLLRLELEIDILPKLDERIQKCAFVRLPDPSTEYRLLLVDRQTVPPSRFFVSDFLGAEFVLNAEERTKRLYRSLIQGRNQVAGELDGGQLTALDQVIAGAVVAQTVNLDNLVASLPVPEPIRELVNAAVSEVLPDREFELDQEVARSFLKRRSFEGDNGLRVSVPTEFFDQMVDVTDVPGTTPRVRQVKIRTQKWREV